VLSIHLRPESNVRLSGRAASRDKARRGADRPGGGAPEPRQVGHGGCSRDGDAASPARADPASLPRDPAPGGRQDDTPAGQAQVTPCRRLPSTMRASPPQLFPPGEKGKRRTARRGRAAGP